VFELVSHLVGAHGASMGIHGNMGAVGTHGTHGLNLVGSDNQVHDSITGPAGTQGAEGQSAWSHDYSNAAGSVDVADGTSGAYNCYDGFACFNMNSAAFDGGAIVPDMEVVHHLGVAPNPMGSGSGGGMMHAAHSMTGDVSGTNVIYSNFGTGAEINHAKSHLQGVVAGGGSSAGGHNPACMLGADCNGLPVAKKKSMFMSWPTNLEG